MRKFIFFLTVFLAMFVFLQTEVVWGQEQNNRLNFFENLQEAFLHQKNLQKKEIARIEKTFKAYAAFPDLLTDSLLDQTEKILGTLQNNQFNFSLALYFVEIQEKLATEYGFDENFHAFHTSLCQMIDASKWKDVVLFIEATYAFLNQASLSSTNSVEWFLNYERFHLEAGLRPSFVFSEVDLKAYAYNDSMVVYQTGGTYYPLRSVFSGEGGFVLWKRIGEKANSMKALLSKYRINLKSTRMEADSVLFYNEQYFTEAVPGRLEDKLSASKNHKESAYPKFDSYTETQISQLYEGINAKGRFVQQGGKMYLGQKKSPTELTIIKDNKVLARIYSENIILTAERFSSPYASWVIYLDEDSLYHSSSEIKYDVAFNRLSIFHSKGVGVEVPFKNTYHAVNISTEALYWDISKGKIDIGLLKIPDRKGETEFVSFQNYDEAEFSKLSSAGDHNILYVLKNLAIEYDYKRIPIYRCAEKFRIAEESARKLLMEYAAYAVVDYKPGDESFIVLPKLLHYMGASANLNDFDNLRLAANTGSLVNAVLSIDSLYIDVYGIQSVLLSPKQNVYFLPDAKTLRLMKNRNMHFHGLVHSGSFDFKVRDAFFNYDDFTLYFSSVDTLQFFVNTKKVNTQIESFSGYLYIDSAHNKSGFKGYEEFPVFKSTKPSYVYYEYDHIHRSAYKKETFYFVVDTFRLSRLNNFVTDSIRLIGTLYSDNMFPPIQEPLVIMPDYSLGFSKLSPQEGWPCYDGKGRFYDTLILNNSGLRAKGRLEYLSSSSKAADFLFLPKRMQASLQEYSSTESEHYAFLYDAKAKEVEADWDLEQGIYTIKTQKEPIYLYKENLELKGALYITDTAARAEGRIDFPQKAVLKSADFKLSKRSFLSDSLVFMAGSGESKNALLRTNRFSFQLDLEKKNAWFTSKTFKDSVYLSQQNYIILAPALRWDLSTQEYSFSLARNLEEGLAELLKKPLEDRLENKLEGIEFISTHRAQKNFKFVGSQARFRIGDTNLSVYGIPYILVADAAIAPHQACLEILKDGYIKDMEKADLLFPYTQANHRFFDASIKIKSAVDYQASGIYKYQAPDIREQNLFFDKIKVEKQRHSVAQSNIERIDSLFMLNAAFRYKGQMKLFSQSQDIFLDGSAYLSYSCTDMLEQGEPSVRFRNYVRPDSIYIPLGDDIRNEYGKRVGMGFYMESSGELFVSFLENIQTSDHPVMTGNGVLSYDSDIGAYIVLKDGKEQFSYHLKDCYAMAEGKADMALSLAPLEASLQGQMIWDIKESKIYMHSVSSFDFFLESALQEQLASIFALSTETPMENISNGMFYQYLQEQLSDKEFKRIAKEIETYGAYQKVPLSLEHTLLFSRLRWDWYPEEKMFIASGDAGLHLIDKKVVNKKMNTTLVLSKSRRGDMIDFYFELSRYKWVYINYHRGLVQILSSDAKFNENIAGLKASKRKKNGFEIALSDMRKKNQFLTMIADIESNDYYFENKQDDESWSEDEEEYEEE